MAPARLDALADGIFAIVMTLLVIEIKIPEIHGPVTNESLWLALQGYGPIIMSYIISFAVLFTYWRAHHYIMGIYAQTVDNRLMTINALFFVSSAFVPFTSGILGLYSSTQIAIIIYSINIIIIGLTLWWMRSYVLYNEHIESIKIGRVEERHGIMRTFLPIVFAGIAIIISYWSTVFALVLLTAAVLFNLIPRGTTMIDHIFGLKSYDE